MSQSNFSAVNTMARYVASLKSQGRLLLAAAFVLTAAFAHAQSTKGGGTMVMIVWPEPPNLATYMQTANPSEMVATKMYEGLLEYNFALEPKPSLAKSWKVSEDGKTISFQLQEGVKFHDGKPFTSADVQFSIMEVLKLHHPRGRITFQDVEAVDTPDAHTAIFRMKQPAPYLLRALSAYESPMVPKHLLQGVDLISAPLMNKPVGTGPFMFVEWNRGQYVRMDRNPNYWKKGLPRLDRVVARFIGDAATRAAALEKGEAHYTGMALPNLDIVRLSKLPQITVTRKGNEVLNPFIQLEINVTRKPLTDPRVRQALSYAIDRKFVVENVWYGYGKPATGPIHSNMKDLYTTDGMPNWGRPDRLAVASKLLDDAGLKADAAGTRFEITLDVAPFGQEWRRLGEYLQQAYGKIGVKVNLRYEDVPSFVRRVYTNYDYDFMLSASNTQSDPVVGTHRYYHTDSIRKGAAWVNGTQWSFKEADDLMNKATVEFNPQKRKALYHVWQRILAEQSPIIWVNELDWVTVHSKRLQNVDNNPLGSLASFENATLSD